MTIAIASPANDRSAATLQRPTAFDRYYLDGHPSAAQINESAQVGYVVHLLCSTPRRAYRLASLTPWVLPAIRLRQIEFYFDSRGQPAGYVTWAFLTDQVAQEYATDHDRLLHLSEWNEGEHLWVIDVVAPGGNLRALLARWRLSRFPDERRIHGLRRDGEGLIRRRAGVRLRALPRLAPARDAR